MERKLAAILAGDVAGYSALMAAEEAVTYNNLRSAFDGIVAPVIEQHAGRIVKTAGDGFLATFTSANEALDAALEIQKRLDGNPLKLRIGLNLGDIIEDNGDVFGDGVNIAARLEAMAEPGGIWVSGTLMRSADKSKDIRFTRLGRRKAKNIPEAIEVYVVRPRSAGWIRSPSVTTWRLLAAAAAAAIVIATGALTYERGWFADLARQTGFLTAPPDLSDTRPTVAVLPFDNLSGDPREDYFADGLTEDIITDLASNRDLMVIARNSTFAFKGRATDVRTIGSELGAQYIVEGSARRSEDQLRIVAQLIDARSGAHVWSRSYNRRAADVFEVQADLTSVIVASLVSYVRQSETESAASRSTENPRAYDLVLQARSLFQHGSKDRPSLIAARGLYRRAIELDPNYAAAHAYLAFTYLADYAQEISGKAKEEDRENGLAAARQAVRLESDSALSYQVLSFALAVSGDYEGSLTAGRRAVELSPSDPDNLMALAKAQVRFGAYEDAVANAERARRLHPLAPGYYAYVHGQALYAANRPEEADRVLAECLLATPREPNCLRIRAAALVRLDRVNEARALVADLVSQDPKFTLAVEQEYRRFGNSPLMERFLKDLSTAGAVGAIGDVQAAVRRRV